MERIIKPAFAVIGMEGSTEDGPGFIPALWEKANARFSEVAELAKYNPDGSPLAIWGAMTGFSRTFDPWEDHFSRGLYLAGVECRDDAQPPAGWVRWSIPGFEYIRVENNSPDAFAQGLLLLQAKNLPLAGAVQELTEPASGKSFLCFPVRRL